MLHHLKTKLRAVTFLFLAATQFVRASDGTYWFAPDGKPDNTGAQNSPLDIASLQKIYRENNADAPLTFLFKDGDYFLETPVTFDIAKNTPTVLRSATSDGKVVFSGGKKLHLKWTPFRDGIFQAEVPATVTAMDQLFVDGKLQILARYPNFDAKARFLNGTAADATSPERVTRWKNPAGGIVHSLHKGLWGGFHHVITGKNGDDKLLLDGGWQNNRPEHGPSATHRFVENIFEELDTAGEWFFDAATRTLYFFPPKDCNIVTAEVIVPQLESLVRVEGTRASPVKNISVEGITFAHTLSTFMKTREPLLRSDWRIYRGGAVFFENAENCAVTRCDFDRVGGNAIFVSNYNRHLRVSGCHITGAGASGVCFVGDADAVRSPLFHYSKTQPLEKIDTLRGAKSDNFPQDCIVEDSLITRIGRVEKQSAGVTLDMASRITVKNCTIAEVPRAGINIGGGTWGGHLLENNDVFDTVLETSDHGAFNSWGRDRFWNPSRKKTETWVTQNPDMPFWDAVEPTTIRHNRFHCEHGWDIDLDDGSSNFLIENNLCLTGGIKLREGYGRTVRNNVTVNNSLHPHVWYAKSGDVVERNIFFRNYAPIGMPAEWGKDIDYNFLHDAGAEKISPAERLQKQSKQDAHSVTGDAQFASPKTGNYQVTAPSPALSLGFKNFAMDNFGVTSPRLKALAPQAPLPKIQVAKPTAQPRNNATISWMGGTFKNIVGAGEQSAAGLTEETGVLVQNTGDADSVFSKLGVQTGDVILEWEKTAVTDLDNFRKASAENKTPKTISVWRNQKKEILPEENSN